MKKNLYLIPCAIASALLLTTACSKDDSVYQPTKQEIMQNAENVLGVKIDSTVNWNMTASAKAAITVNGMPGETYTVKIYSNDPLMAAKGYVLKQGKVESGQTFTASFEYPAALRTLVVAAADSKGFVSYKALPVIDGTLETSFGGTDVAEARTTRSRSLPTVPNIDAPYDNAWVSEYLATAKEPTAENINHNHDNGYYSGGDGADIYNPVGKASDLIYNHVSSGDEAYDAFVEKWIRPYFTALWWGGQWTDVEGATDKNSATTIIFAEMRKAGYNWSEMVNGYPGSEVVYVPDENYVLNYKITNTWNGIIDVVGSEGYIDGKRSYAERTVVITGTWNLTEDQGVGGLGRIIVANGGKIVLSEGKRLLLANEARLVVLQGGSITGQGEIMVTNGNAVGQEGYNAGTIDVYKVNNNFGKFYNNGTLKATYYAASSTESNIYNHGVVSIKSTDEPGDNNSVSGLSPNARIYNACQWFCENDMRAYIIECTMGSYFYVGGQLMMSVSNDGSNEWGYVSLANGALMRLGSLYNNNTDWIGPTNGIAVLEMGRVTFLNWQLDTAPKHGYFINNISITLSDKTSTCGGNNYDNGTGQAPSAYEKMRDRLINGTNGTANYIGNNGTVFVEEGGANLKIPRDEGFQDGVRGCTPGYEGQGRNIYEMPAVWTYAFEDTPLGDYDMNDVVIRVAEDLDDDTKLNVTLCAAGASFDLKIYLDNVCIFGNGYIEVHKVFGRGSGELINTGGDVEVTDLPTTQIPKPTNFSFATADFWIDSPAVVGGVHLATQGEDPHAVAIPFEWRWPREQVKIINAYPRFTDFINYKKGIGTSDAEKWYENSEGNPVEDLVYFVQ